MKKSRRLYEPNPADDLRKVGVRTAAVHAGTPAHALTGASAPDIVMSTTFVIDPSVPFSADEINDETPFTYTRWGNPTIRQLERKLAVLEGAEEAVAFGSGVAAIAALFLTTLKGGDHLVMSDVTYAAASEFANQKLPNLGIAVTRVDTSDPENVRAALRPETRLVYLETPVNPLLRLTDVEAVVKIAHEAGVPVSVDSTFATPIGLRPVELGADYVVQSLTKYICGHGDAIGGAVIGRGEELNKLRTMAIHMGGIISPFNAWLIMRGLATLPLRMAAHQETALAVAKHLEGHPKITRVVYPGLPSHPQHELARRQMQNFSGMLTFQVQDGAAAARLLSDRLQLIHYAVSLGHNRSLVCYLSTDDLLRSSFHLTPEQERSYRAFAGDGVFRLSVGLEDAADLIADLDQALAPL
ncbi:MAG: aminotransferase class I/II-fold pyridoxal phosphate-dependent enzyme [Actinomycetia bacterium]|nr:aminotransferase class I/II-fold pyridoxal phosphate-dependent enzyme [Actinomycetes bacterium]